MNLKHTDVGLLKWPIHLCWLHELARFPH